MKNPTLSMVLLSGALALPLAAQEKQTDKPPAEQQKKVEPLKIGATVDENLALPDLDGKTWTMKDLRGKVVFVHFWSVYCPYEVAAEPKFRALLERYEDKGVVQLAIESNQNELDFAKEGETKTPEHKRVRDHVKEKGMPYPILIDRGNKVSDYFGGRCTPHCFVIDAKGVLVYQGALDDDPKGDKGDAAKVYVSDAIAATLEGKPLSVKETKPYG